MIKHDIVLDRRIGRLSIALVRHAEGHKRPYGWHSQANGGFGTVVGIGAAGWTLGAELTPRPYVPPATNPFIEDVDCVHAIECHGECDGDL